MKRQIPLMFFAKTSKILQLQIIKIVIKALHQKEITKPTKPDSEHRNVGISTCLVPRKRPGAFRSQCKGRNSDQTHQQILRQIE